MAEYAGRALPVCAAAVGRELSGVSVGSRLILGRFRARAQRSGARTRAR